MRSKCLTLKAKECSRLISEWDVSGGRGAWGFLASPHSPPHKAGAIPAFLSLQCQGDADHAGGEVFQRGGNRPPSDTLCTPVTGLTFLGTPSPDSLT